MSEIKVYIPDELNEQFRKAAMMTFGYSKGSLSQAAEQALGNWSKNVFDAKDFLKKNDDPIQAMKGLLKGVKEDSVTLQHEAWNSVIKKYAKK